MVTDFSAWPNTQPITPTPPFIESIRPETVVTTSVSGDGIYLVRIDIIAPIAIDTMAVYIGNTAAGNLDLGVYEKTASGYSLVASTGSTAAGSANAVQAITLTTQANLMPGVNYYVALAISDGSCNIGAAGTYDGIAAVSNRSLLKASTFPLSASLTGPTAIGAMPWIIGYLA